MEKYVHIGQLFLEEGDYFEAERHLIKSLNILSDVKDKFLIIRYKGSMARIYEFKQKFIEAASRYYELSHIINDHEESKQALESAIICSIMAPAGPQRSRQLSMLYKDERSSQLALFPILQKMFIERILNQSEIETFGSLLKDRPSFINGENSVLENAMREHNLLSASKVYLNISFNELGFLLNVSSLVAEKLASKMISEKRLEGSIDQINALIHFHSTESIRSWDHHIETTCSQINIIVDLISSKNPEFVEKASKLLI